MHIVNIMFSKISGGIEQAFVDYCEALQNLGHKVTAITHPEAAINKELCTLGIKPIMIGNHGALDPLAILRLRWKCKKLAPGIAIAHTTRSFALARPATRGLCPLVGVVHNYNPKARKLIQSDAVFTTTNDLTQFVMQYDIPENRIFMIPNMVRCDELPARGVRNTPPVIGTMGRFVAKKGFHVFIDAMQMLHQRGYHFKAIIGGTGEETKELKKRAKLAGLNGLISFPGWVENKKTFYTNIDIFCLPSLHEPFGIVLLEAFVHGAPVVATDTEGPRDIITPNFDAIMVRKDNATELASAIAKLLDNPPLGAMLASNAFVKAKTKYSLESVGESLEKALFTVIARYQQQATAIAKTPE